MMRTHSFVVLFLMNILITFVCVGQAPPEKLTVTQKQKIIKSVGKLLKDKYVFPKVADKMAAYLEKQQKNKAYASITSTFRFGDLLTRDLQAISKDKHIRVRFNPKSAKEAAAMKNQKPSPDMVRKWEERARNANFGFEKVERLAGNIGYLDLRGFLSHDTGAETVANALGFLANTKGIIIDLRKNGGGSPKMVQLICSYFFGKKPLQLNGFYWREGNRKEEFWTLKDIKGKRMPDKPLYILTSNRTFSAAEDFSYNMQARKRATIVGETTGGGAHPGGAFPVEEMYMMFVPVGRSINPITKTNWEGVGVIPEIKVSADKALDKAYLELLKSLKSKKNAPRNADWLMQGIEAKINPVQIDLETMQAFAGVYTHRHVIFKDKELFYQRPSLSKKIRKLTPLTKNLFAVEGIPFFRLEFVKDNTGKVTQVVGVYEDGERNVSKRGALKK